MKKMMDPKMVKRQILLINQNFSSYPQGDQDTEARLAEALESDMWPLVKHIVLFEYPEFTDEVLKLSKFPADKVGKDKWLNEFASDLNSEKMFHNIVFTKENAESIDSSLPEMLNALNAIKLAIPFVHIEIEDASIIGEIYFSAMDRLKEWNNLVLTVGGTD